MKKLIVLLIAFTSLFACNNKAKDYVSISGKIDGLQKTDTTMRVVARGYNKIIKINDNGSFKDTLKLKKADSYNFIVSPKVRFNAYLKNGYDLTLSGKADDFQNTLSFTGIGAKTNNYIVSRMKKVLEFNKERANFSKLDSTSFNNKLNAFESEIKEMMVAVPELDSIMLSNEQRGLKGYLANLKGQYNKQRAMEITLGKGKPSPKFVNYENFKGGKTSLDDFKGKYVYIDVWATWCRPCLGQIPDLKELEKEYHGKNIEFVSISTDKPEKHQAWINMIKSKGMGGTQLFAGKDMEFMKEYQINSIPRFIFIGKNGEILNANAPRPSQKEAVKAMFTENGLK